jgi:hypothetical protein
LVVGRRRRPIWGGGDIPGGGAPTRAYTRPRPGIGAWRHGNPRTPPRLGFQPQAAADLRKDWRVNRLGGGPTTAADLGRWRHSGRRGTHPGLHAFAARNRRLAPWESAGSTPPGVETPGGGRSSEGLEGEPPWWWAEGGGDLGRWRHSGRRGTHPGLHAFAARNWRLAPWEPRTPPRLGLKPQALQSPP